MSPLNRFSDGLFFFEKYMEQSISNMLLSLFTSRTNSNIIQILIETNSLRLTATNSCLSIITKAGSRKWWKADLKS